MGENVRGRTHYFHPSEKNVKSQPQASEGLYLKSHFTSYLNTITSEYEGIQGSDAVMYQTVHNSTAS